MNLCLTALLLLISLLAGNGALSSSLPVPSSSSSSSSSPSSGAASVLLSDPYSSSERITVATNVWDSPSLESLQARANEYTENMRIQMMNKKSGSVHGDDELDQYGQPRN